ncbi:hypothetical protein CAEBREN_11376 [Caenorhabditis brenneri]|uniref:Uncharacterized protein n=1 Tax=Caenorhabditis brenneri TaxID=135651 RepID=G0PD24_CAEBE|nr:hypothetical protein CAEBREN_11376 [Caenorhabditis brenneri]
MAVTFFGAKFVRNSSLKYFSDHPKRLRNIAQDSVTFLKPTELKFELHWFTIDGAESFVKEVLNEVCLRLKFC